MDNIAVYRDSALQFYTTTHLINLILKNNYWTQIDNPNLSWVMKLKFDLEKISSIKFIQFYGFQKGIFKAQVKLRFTSAFNKWKFLSGIFLSFYLGHSKSGSK